MVLGSGEVIPTLTQLCWVWSVATAYAYQQTLFQRPSISYGNTISFEAHVDAIQSSVFIGGRKVAITTGKQVNATS